MILGIMGGMGPAATCDFYRKITELTHVTKDQEHLHIVIDSNSQIPDRTKYICGYGEDPRIEMIRSAIKLEMMGADYIAIPCNTAHYLYDDIVKYTKVKIIHIIHETAAFLKATSPEKQDFLLLATEGVYLSGTYKRVFKEYNLNIIEPNERDRQSIMRWIYGVKCGKFDVSPIEIQSLINRYMEEDSIPIILGCTELPLLAEKTGVPNEYIDPVSILARCCVNLLSIHTSCLFTDTTIPLYAKNSADAVLKKAVI